MYTKEDIKRIIRDIGIEPKESYFKEEELYTCFNTILELYVIEIETMEISLRTKEYWEDFARGLDEVYIIEKYKGE